MNIIKEIQEENPFYQIGSRGIIGTRDYQQDLGYYYTGTDCVFSIICDGMGGMEGGERASRAAVDQFVQDFRQERGVVNVPEFLVKEAGRLNQVVAGLKNSSGAPLQGGTTLVAVYCSGNQMYWVSVGDSRIYLIRGNRIKPLNREHNYRLTLQMNLESGLINKDTYDRESTGRQADALVSYIGMEQLAMVDVSQAPIIMQEGDVVVLCSDGVCKSLNDSQICAMVRDNDVDMDIAADRLTGMAMRYGARGQDNTTVILVKYLGR